MNDLVRRNRGASFDNMLDKWFNSSLDTMFGGLTGGKLLSDIDENENEYIITAELPGCEKDNVAIDFEDDVITIKATYDEKAKDSIRSGTYQVGYTLRNLDANNAEATINNGILKVKLPKTEASKPKKILIA